MLNCQLDMGSFHNKVKGTIHVIQEGVLIAARVAAQQAAAYAKMVGQFKDRTGNLRGGIYAKYLSSNKYGAKWEIVSPAKYSKYVEYGTAPHIIRPKASAGFIGPNIKGKSTRAPNDYGAGRGHALRWKVGGVNRFARVVHHPGSKSHPFMFHGLSMAETSLYRSLHKVIQQAEKIWHV